MKEKAYYNEIKNIIETYEVNHKVRTLQDNSEKLQMKWNIGRLLVEAQGGLNRAKYGDNLIKKWSINFAKLYGKRYSARELRRMQQFYYLFSIWSHAIEILSLKNKRFKLH